VSFVVTNCAPITTGLPDRTTEGTKEPVGDANFLLLDANYELTGEDVGITGLAVGNNPNAAGIALVAEIENNHIDNDVTVRMVDVEKDALVSVFYKAGKSFPHKIAMTVGETDAIGTFGDYSEAAGTFSLTMAEPGTDETYTFDLKLNENVIDKLRLTKGFSHTQTARINDLLMTVAILDSFNQIDEHAFDMRALSKESGWDKFVKGLCEVGRVIFNVVVVVAVVAVIVVVTVYSPPLGAALMVGIGIAMQNNADKNSAGDGGNRENIHSPPAPNAQRPKVNVFVAGEDDESELVCLQNNSSVRYRLKVYEGKTFGIEIVSLGRKEGGKEFSPGEIFNPASYGIDHNGFLIEDENSRQNNLHFFERDMWKWTNKGKGKWELTVVRKAGEGTEWAGEGEVQGNVQIVLYFGTDVLFNHSLGGSLGGYVLDGERLKEVTDGGNLFVLNFNAIPPAKEGN